MMDRIEDEIEKLKDAVEKVVHEGESTVASAEEDAGKAAAAVQSVATGVTAPSTTTDQKLVPLSLPSDTRERDVQEAAGLISVIDPALAPVIAAVEKVVSVIDDISAHLHTAIADLRRSGKTS
jgi:hypothetical protein